MRTDAKGTGRKRHFDPKNLDYLVETSPTDAKVALRVSRGATISTRTAEGDVRLYRPPELTIDQGDTPQCTAASAMTLLALGDVTQTALVRQWKGSTQAVRLYMQQLYDEIVAIDRREGRYYTEGATMLAAAKALKARGLITGYQWAYDLKGVIAGMQSGRSAWLGVDMYDGMCWPDAKYGVMRAFGRVHGGHAMACSGLDLDLNAGFLDPLNTWGRGFAINGRGRIPLEDLEWLLADGGECLFVDEVKLPAAA